LNFDSDSGGDSASGEAGPYAEQQPSLALRSKVRLFFLFALDLGFCLAEDDQPAKDHLLETRATGPVTDLLFGAVTISLAFAGLNSGKLETRDILDRMRRAKEAGGKPVWAATLLEDEAPYRFERALSGARKVPREGVHFYRSPQIVRVFPRGVLTVEQQWELDPEDADTPVSGFIAAVKSAREQAANDAWTALREMLTNLAQHPPEGLAWRWSGTEPTHEAFLRQHLLSHTMIFMDSLPGESVPVYAHPSFDHMNVRERNAVVGILNLTEWYEYYSECYSERVFGTAVRNRVDEIYVTDNDASVIILANYWLEGDPLEEYQCDLVLATQFELARLTHLRFLAPLPAQFGKR
jgi:hypothetical protein